MESRGDISPQALPGPGYLSWWLELWSSLPCLIFVSPCFSLHTMKSSPQLLFLMYFHIYYHQPLKEASEGGSVNIIII